MKARVEVHLALHGKAGSHAANLFLQSWRRVLAAHESRQRRRQQGLRAAAAHLLVSLLVLAVQPHAILLVLHRLLESDTNGSEV